MKKKYLKLVKNQQGTAQQLEALAHTILSPSGMHLLMYSCIYWVTPSAQPGNATTATGNCFSKIGVKSVFF